MKKDPKLHEGHFERVRTAILDNNVHDIQDVTALEMMLQCPIRRGDTNEIARRILDKYGCFSQFCSLATYDDLLKIEGIGDTVAIKLLCFCKLVDFSIVHLDKMLGGEVVSLESIFRFLKLIYRKEFQEVVFLFVLNEYNKLMHYQILAKGSPDNVSLDIMQINDVTRMYHGQKVLISHNHPNGSFYPSVADLDTTERIIALCKSKQIEFIDHVIVSDTGCFSFKGSHLLEFMIKRMHEKIQKHRIFP